MSSLEILVEDGDHFESELLIPGDLSRQRVLGMLLQPNPPVPFVPVVALVSPKAFTEQLAFGG